MPTPHPTDPQPSLSSLLHTLLPLTNRLLHPPIHSTHPSLTAAISALQLHPTLEATLHLLNADLPSAHFLVRHMQAPPAVEGMLLHSILHRTEGDFRNARAWASDVRDACEGWVPKRRGGERLGEGLRRRIGGGEGIGGSVVEYVYGEGEGMEGLIDDVEALRKEGGKGEEVKLEEKIRIEMERVFEWCKEKFGDGRWADASEAWTKDSEEVKSIANEMTTGERGWRKF